MVISVRGESELALVYRKRTVVIVNGYEVS